MSGIYPVGVEVAPGRPVARWRPLVNWLLVLPLLLWLYLLAVGGAVVVVLAWFAIVCSGRMPGRLGDYLMSLLRYGWRVGAFLFGLTDRYPGFRLVAGYVDPCDQPAVFYSAQPLDRKRVTVVFRLVLLLPVLLFGLAAATVLVGLLFAGWWIVLAVGRWPDILRRSVVGSVVGCFGYLLCFAAYAWLIVDVFPPLIPVSNPAGAEDTPTFVRIRPDPREVTGPPWPRLVDHETYQPPDTLKWPIWTALVLTVMAVVGPITAVIAAPNPAPYRSAFSSAVAPATSTQLASTLKAVIAGPPEGGYVGHESGAENGPLNLKRFNKWMSDPSATDEYGFLAGYQVTYYLNDGTDDDIYITLLQFASSSSAQIFQADHQIGFPGQSHPDTVIPDTLDYDAAKMDPDGAYDHGIIGIKGDRVFVIDYLTGTAAPVPTLESLARSQYASL